MAFAIDDMGNQVDRSYLKKGTTGDGVTSLQNNLTGLGYNVGTTGADGIYGPNTEGAVKQFQKEAGINVDGIAGPETRKTLSSILSSYDNVLGSDVNLTGNIETSTKKQMGQAQPTYTPPQQQTFTAEVDPNKALMDVLTALLNQKTQITPYQAPASTLPAWAQNLQPFTAPAPKVLNFDEALSQAINMLNPKYDVAQRQLEDNLKLDQESRGLFFSPVGAQLSSNKLMDFTSNKQSDMNQYAENLVGKSQDQANKTIEQALAQWQANTGLATNLINIDENKSNNAYNQWLQSQGLNLDANNSQVSNATNLVNTINGLKTSSSAEKKAAVDAALSRAEMFGSITNETDAKILGVPVGTTTTQAKLANSSILNDTVNRDSALIEAALKRAEVTGTVNNEADAKILGVSVGTTTQAAKVINSQLDERQFSQDMAKLDAALKRVDAFGSVSTAEDAKLLGVPIGTSSLNARTNAAQIKSMQLGDAINKANLTGTITNAADAKLLGVKVGTSTLEARNQAFTQAMAKLDAVMKRVDLVGFVDREASKLLGVPVGTKSMSARQLAQQMVIAKMDAATARASNKTASSGTNTAKVNQLMDVWKITGYAPGGLESLGIKAGTPFTPGDSAKPDAKALSGIQKQFGTDSNTADDIYTVWQSPTRESAIAELQAATAAAAASGQTINTDMILKAIDYKWKEEITNVPGTTLPAGDATFLGKTLEELINGGTSPRS